MSIDFGSWLKGNGSIIASQHQIRAQIQQARIEDKATAVSFLRDGVFLPDQMVRVEYDDAVTDQSSELGTAGLRRVTLFGTKGHPEIDDLDVRAWDTFRMDEIEFTVKHVNRTLIGQIQAHCEAVG